MKDYLNAEERNQTLLLMAVLQNMNGLRSINSSTPQPSSMVEGWTRRNNLTPEEKKSLKLITTYITKFTESLMNRLAPKEKEELNKRFMKFDIRLIDDLTLQKIYRDFNSNENAVVPKRQFYKWTEEIMNCNCNGCSKRFDECKLYDVLENNFIPESTWNKSNCKFAYEGTRKLMKEGKK